MVTEDSPKKKKAKSASGSRSAKGRKATSSRLRKPPKPVEEEGPLTPEEVETYHQLLLIRRRELLRDVDQMGGEALLNDRQETAGDLSSMPIHMADVGTDNYEQEFTINLIASDRETLRNIDRALAKIAAGTYGLCEGTGQYINRSRLNAKPEARYCIEFARKIEQGLVNPEAFENESAARTAEESA